MKYKNTSGQKIAIYAFDTAAGAAKTGDAANITAQISLDYGTSAATNDANPTELDATNHPGIYVFDLTQAETNADVITVTATSSTSDVHIEPVVESTLPTAFKTACDNYTAAKGLAGTNLDAAISSRVATSALPSNFGDLAITATTGQITVGTNNDKTGYFLGDGAHGGSSSTLTLSDYRNFLATGFSTLDSAGVRSAVGLSSANLDTQLGSISTAVLGVRSDVEIVDGKVDSVLLDTGEVQQELADGGRLDLILDSILSGLGSVTVADIAEAALAKFVTTDTGETTAVDGSVGKIAQGAAGNGLAESSTVDGVPILVALAAMLALLANKTRESAPACAFRNRADDADLVEIEYDPTTGERTTSTINEGAVA